MTKSWETVIIKNENGESVEAIAPVIVSASRATDIPAFYSEWFMDRLKTSNIVWRNPFNNKQQHVSFSKTRVIVFWTKNPVPMIPFLGEIDRLGINYYFQFTLNDYENEGLEPNIPSLKDRIGSFKKLSSLIGKSKVVWRFDPLILTDEINIDKLVAKILSVGEEIHDYTDKLVISFADISNYRKVKSNLRQNNVHYIEFDKEKMIELSKELMKSTKGWTIDIATCAEEIDLERIGIQHNRCIDDRLMRTLFSDDKMLVDFLNSGKKLRDPNQRKACGCMMSKDIGQYNTCKYFCKYCYATR